MVWYIQYLWWRVGGQNRETDEEHHEDCVEEGFQLARELDKHGERGREALGMGNHTINILIICIKTGTSLVQ